jgi:hypothetical protein
MQGMNNTKMATRTWECCLPYKLFLFENGVMRIMFELKTEDMGGKGCKMWAFMIYTACQILGYQRRVARICEECGMHGSDTNLANIFIGKLERKSPLKDLR